MLQFIRLTSGDVALVVNGQIVMSAAPSIDDTKLVESTAEALATALDEGLFTRELPTPTAEEWTWESIVASLDCTGAVTQ